MGLFRHRLNARASRYEKLIEMFLLNRFAHELLNRQFSRFKPYELFGRNFETRADHAMRKLLAEASFLVELELSGFMISFDLACSSDDKSSSQSDVSVRRRTNCLNVESSIESIDGNKTPICHSAILRRNDSLQRGFIKMNFCFY